MCWFYLGLAAVAEILFVLTMKLSDGFTRIGYALGCIAAGSIGLFFLALATKKIPIATAYAIWTGLGVVGTVLLDYFLFQTPLSSAKLTCIALILAGAVGLKLL